MPTLSYILGSLKPFPVNYLTAAESINTPLENCLFIDDLQRNVDGAIDIGMQAIRFTNETELREYLIESGILD
ncbi:MAG: HAD-IA family hydrolase [Desulfobulbaceae bacterium]|nr:HAD-IA family hydrolase [Desulfobulbaceae bacterium]